MLHITSTKSKTYGELTDELFSIFDKTGRLTRFGEDDDTFELMFNSPEDAKWAMKRLKSWKPFFDEVDFDSEDNRVIVFKYKDTPFKADGIEVTSSCKNKKKKQKSAYQTLEDSFANIETGLDDLLGSVMSLSNSLDKLSKPIGMSWGDAIETAGSINNFVSMPHEDIADIYGDSNVNNIKKLISFVSDNRDDVSILFEYGVDSVMSGVKRALKAIRSI